MSSRFLDHLPVGESLPLPADNVTGWEIFPFEGTGLRVRPLDEPVLPEPPRHGEDGPADCASCLRPMENTIWADDHWRVHHLGGASAVPAKVLLSPLAHSDLHDLPAERSAEIGPLLQRVERAFLALGGVARVHVARWGDGASHLHIWLVARPARCSCAAPASPSGTTSCHPCRRPCGARPSTRSPPTWPRTAAPPTRPEPPAARIGR